MVAHAQPAHAVPDDLTDEAAVMVEPTACAVHAARRRSATPATRRRASAPGTLGLLDDRRAAPLAPTPARIVATAKHPEQRRLARELGADRVVEPDELARAVRSAHRVAA